MSIDYFEGVEKPAVDLNVITELAIEADDIQNELDSIAVKVAELEARQAEILRKRIPELLEMAGMDQIKMQNGAMISVVTEIKASISQANAETAFGWLEEHGFDGIIKTKITSEFGRGELEEAKEILAQLEAEGVAATLKREVHPSTLKSFVKERLEHGDNIPVDAFGIFEYKIAKIKKAKSR